MQTVPSNLFVHHLVAIALLVEGGKGADDGEEHRAEASEEEVKEARRGTEGPDDCENGDIEDDCNDVIVTLEMTATMPTLRLKDMV